MQEEVNKPQKAQDSEVDLMAFFSMMGRFFRRVYFFVKAIFISLLDVFLFVLLLIKRNLIWLSIVTILGFALGLYKYMTRTPVYYADMVVEANFESGRLLYQKVDFFNSLIRENKKKELAQVFSIPQADADALYAFEISAIDEPLEKAKLYRANFLDYKHNSTSGVDTVWTKILKYKDFEGSLTKYDYPLQSIRLFSTNSSVYSKVQAGLMNIMKENASVNQVKDATIEMLRNEEQILISSLAGIDSLRKAYNKRLVRQAETGNGAGGMVFMQGSQRAPEIELYDKELTLKDELMAVKKKIIDHQNVINVYADFNPVGEEVGVFRHSMVMYTIYPFCALLLLLLLIDIYKWLGQIEKANKSGRSNKRSSRTSVSKELLGTEESSF
jgi:uncharacterized membrane protein